jgi:hypothetical protein
MRGVFVFALLAVVACGPVPVAQSASQSEHPKPPAPPPVRAGVPPPGDEAGFRKLLVGAVAYGGLWFSDSTCQAQFGSAGTVAPAAFDAFAHCVAGLHLRPTGRADSFDDTSVLTDDNGFEIEARVAAGKLDFIGFSARASGWSDEPSITPATLESLRASGDPNASLSADEVSRMVSVDDATPHQTMHLRVCLAEDGRVSTILPGSTTLYSWVTAFSTIVRTWTFRPFTVGGKPMAVCSIIGFQYPATPADADREQLPRPPHFSRAGHVVWNVGPHTLENLRASGSKYIYPDDMDNIDLHGGRLIGSFKLCIDETGHYESGTVIKSTGLPRYDAKIARTIMQWTYHPYLAGGVAVPVCTAVTFIYSQH